MVEKEIKKPTNDERIGACNITNYKYRRNKFISNETRFIDSIFACHANGDSSQASRSINNYTMRYGSASQIRRSDEKLADYLVRYYIWGYMEDWNYVEYRKVKYLR